jgi:hypothetical protein
MNSPNRDVGFLGEYYCNVAVILDNVTVGLRHLAVEGVRVAAVLGDSAARVAYDGRPW